VGKHLKDPLFVYPESVGGPTGGDKSAKTESEQSFGLQGGILKLVALLDAGVSKFSETLGQPSSLALESPALALRVRIPSLRIWAEGLKIFVGKVKSEVNTLVGDVMRSRAEQLESMIPRFAFRVW
jgi:hypothetical protein